MRVHYKSLFILSCFSILLNGCGGSSSSDPEPLRVPEVNAAKSFDGPLTQGNADRFIKNGIYGATLARPAPSVPSDNAGSPEFSASDNFSRTNTIEEGVDEADRVKYDGNTLFLASYPIWQESGPTSPEVRVMARNQDFTLTEQTAIQFQEEFVNIQGLYLQGDRLAVVGSDYPVYPVDALTSFAPWVDNDPHFTLRFYDVSETDNITQVQSLKIDGSLLSSRRIENNLYVVSSYVPYVPNLLIGELTDEQKLANYQQVLSISSNDLMPKMHRDGQGIAMNQMSQCYIPDAATADDGYPQLLTITRINMVQPNDTESMCMSVYAFMMYMSQQSVYVASSDLSDRTTFHKVSLDNLTYQASGSVNGVLSWSSDPRFKVDEKDDYFRVISTDFSDGTPVHSLYVLQQQGNQLQTVAQLPNDSQPEAIGKPNEDIYAVRFIDDKAYIVTFERLDPLYVVDLTDNTQPFIAGSLEIPGFSSYLQPLKNDIVLGIGQEVNLLTLPGSGDQVIELPTASGLKVSLFDVRDPANPLELGSVVAPDGYTPVEYNYKALSWIEEDGVYRFAFPVENWNAENTFGIGQNQTPDAASKSLPVAMTSPPPPPKVYVPRNSLMLLEVDTKEITPQIEHIANIEAESDPDNYIFAGDDRSVIHGAKVYYIRGNQIWLSDWTNPDSVEGPY